MKKSLSILLIVFAVGIGVIPLFTDCESQARSLTLQDGRSVPMKCHWTAIAEVGVGAMLGLTGLLMLFSQRKETDRSLSVMGIAAGALAILFPTVLIGVCANATMLCNMVMRPTLVALGTLAILASAVILFNTRRLEVAA
ncbi:MAG: DUF4418 family protein [Chloroflexi bacterium]|nr:DUF4418 family protein [Chloroflexota bacterium]